MKLTYDPSADALYVQMTPSGVARAVEVQPDIDVDPDAENEVVGHKMRNVRLRNTEQCLELELPSRQDVLTATG